MQQAMYQLGVKQYKSSAYHPESQGALERFHQTLKNMLRAYCTENNRDWDQGVHLLLFTAREIVQELLGFSPFELVFGRTVRGPLKLLKEAWLAEESSINLLDQVADLCYRLVHTRLCSEEFGRLGTTKEPRVEVLKLLSKYLFYFLSLSNLYKQDILVCTQ